MRSLCHGSPPSWSCKFFQFVVLLPFFLFFPYQNCFSLPPLSSVDWSLPRDAVRPFENLVVADVNVFTKSLDGKTLAAGPLILEYDEAYQQAEREFGNFALKAVIFSQGPAVLIPRLEQRGGSIDNVALHYGVRTHALRKLFTVSAPPPPGTIAVTRVGYSLEKHGRFFYRLRHDELPSGMSSSRVVHDTATETAYFYNTELGGAVLSGILSPSIAYLPGGFEVEFSYTPTGALDFLRLKKNFVNIETITFSYLNGVITLASSDRDPAHRTKFLYTGTGDLEYVLRGGDNTIAGSIGGYRLLYTTVGEGADPIKNALTGLTTLSGHQVVRYTLSAVTTPLGERSIYTAVQHGPVSVTPVTFEYLTANQLRVHSPIATGNPLTLTLHPTRGILLKVENETCPQPLQEVQLITSPGPREGLVYKEFFRLRCSTLLTRTYIYTSTGRLTNVDQNVDGQSTFLTYQYKNVQLPNGVSVSKIRQVGVGGGDYTAWNYNDNGRLNSISVDQGALTTSFSYNTFGADWWNTERVTTTHPSGRQDYARFDEQGRLIEVVENVGSGSQISRSVTNFDVRGRIQRYLDEKGNATQVSYISANDDRIQQEETVAADNSEIDRVLYGYDAEFPGYVSSVDSYSVKPANGNTKRVVTGYEYRSDFPLLEKITVSTNLTPQQTLASANYDPVTLQLMSSCGYSSNINVPESCTTYSYKPTSAGLLAGHLDVITNPEGYTTTLRYDSYGNVEGVIEQRDSTSSVTTAITLDGLGRLRAETIQPGDAQFEQRKDYFYDALGKLARTMVTRSGTVVSDLQYQYDDGERSFRPVRVDDLYSGVWKEFEYLDPVKRLTRMTTFAPSGTVIAQRVVASQDYDSYNRALRERIQIEGVGEVEVARSYNRFGEVTSFSDGRGNQTLYDYDTFGRLEKIEDAHTRRTLTYGIDNLGRSTPAISLQHLTTNPALSYVSTTSFVSDLVGRFVESVNSPSQVKSLSSYDARGALAEILTRYELSGESETLEFAHDNLGHVTQVKHDNAILWERDFNAFSQIVALRDSSLNQTTYRYDPLGRIQGIDYPDQTTSAIGYIDYMEDGLKLVQILSRSGDIGYAGFNQLGQLLLKIILPIASGGYIQQSEYLANRLINVSSSETSWVPESSDVDYAQYDSFGRPGTEAVSYRLNEMEQSYALGKTYDALGSITGYIYPNGTQVEYQRDAFGRVDTIIVNGIPTATYTYDGEFLAQVQIGTVQRSYQYDAQLPMLRRVTDRVNGVVVGDVQLNYDSRYRLIGKQDYGQRDWDETFTYTNHHMVNSVTVNSPTHLGGQTVNRVFGTQLDGVLTGLLYPATDEVFRLIDSFDYDSRGRPYINNLGDFIRYYWTIHGLSIVTSEVDHVSFGQDALGRYLYSESDGMLGYQSSLYAWEEGMTLWQQKSQ